MLNSKQTLIIQNSIELGEDISDEAKGKGRVFTSRFIVPGVAHYEEFGDVLITKETLDKFIHTMVGCPVIIKHKDIDDKNADKERVGVVSEVWFNEADGWFYCKGIIWDKQAIDLVKNQNWNVSCTYDFDTDNQEKIHNGKKIDREFTGGEFLHLALVPNPRYERANIVMNSIENAKDWDGNEGEWITVKGNHLFIKKGQSKDEVVKSFIEKQGDKPSDKKESSKDKSSDSKEKLSDKELSFIEKQKNLVPWGVKIFRHSEHGLLSYTPDDDTFEDINGNFYDGKDIDKDSIVKINVDDYKKTNIKEDKTKYIDKKDDSKEVKSINIDKLKTSLQDEIKKANTDKWYTKDKDKNFAGIYSFVRQNKELSEIFKNNPKIDDVKVGDMLGLHKLDEFKSLTSTKKKKIYDVLRNRWLINKPKEVNNKGDITMTVLNELKDFIKSVVKNEKDKEMEEVKNEDKRKLIDEVGGILKGKVDDEIIRTIIKKMEEASYEPSEDDKADNEADEEEKEEKFEEEKKIADNKKAKNEEKEDKDDEVDKEEVKNKCKNSMNEIKDMIMGGSTKVKSNYISKDDRFALGEKY